MTDATDPTQPDLAAAAPTSGAIDSAYPISAHPQDPAAGESATPPAPVRIRPRERDAILQSLRAGVVPRIGQQHFQVGRVNEVKALLTDIDRLVDGGSGFRFIIGDYGSGKTFFLRLVSSIAMQRKLVTVTADLAPDRRLFSTGGQARSLYAELMRTMATRANPEGGALESVVERFVTQAIETARVESTTPDVAIQRGLHELTEMTNGYDFAQVVGLYWKGHDEGNTQLQHDAVRWLRGEFATRTDARTALGVRTIVDDANVYDGLKLMARFVRLAGFGGLLIALDEMVNLYKLSNTQARNANYEQLLRMINDSTQGIAEGIGFVFSGTPDFLMDTRRGLYSYPALQGRLQENAFARDGLVDYAGPVLRLASLTPEDLFILLQKLRHVQASGDETAYVLPDDALHAFMDHCANRIGESYFRSPRNTIRTFLDLLAILEQNPDADWRQLIQATHIADDVNPDLEPLPEPIDAAADAAESEEAESPPPLSDGTFTQDDDLKTFKL